MDQRKWAILRLGLIAMTLLGLAGPLVRASSQSPGSPQIAQFGNLITQDDETCDSDGVACTDDDADEDGEE